MKAILTTAATLVVLSGAAFAESHAAMGDAEAGEKEFRKCKACHAIVDDEGEAIVRGGKTGPNLYNVVGRQAGSDPEFNRYSDTIVELGEEGLVWTPEELAAYIPNAREYLQEKSGDSSVRSAMTPQRLDSVDDMVAYLVSVSPDYDPEEEMEDSDS